MSAPGVDPLLPMMVRGRSLQANNDFRVKLMVEAAATMRRDPAAFAAYLRSHLEWGQTEAVARDRAGDGDIKQLAAASPSAGDAPLLKGGKT